MKRMAVGFGALLAIAIYAAWFYFAWGSPELHEPVAVPASAGRAASISELGQFGDAFGVINALFASVTVGLVWVTYLGQRNELKQIGAHFAEERRMETLKLLLDGFDQAINSAKAGSGKGPDFVSWASGQAIDLLVSASFESDKGKAWTTVLTSGDLADPKALAGAAECFRAMSHCVTSAGSDQERMTMLALIRGRVVEAFGPGLLVSCAALFQGDHAALRDMDFVFTRLRHDFDAVYARMRLVNVTGGRPATKYDTYYVDDVKG